MAMVNDVHQLDLTKLAEIFFRWRGLIPDTSIINTLNDKDLRHLQWILYDATEFKRTEANERIKLQGIGVILKDWRRPCNFKVILSAENIQKKYPYILQKMIVISDSFSPAAEKAAEKTNVLLLTQGELVSIVKTSPDLMKIVKEHLKSQSNGGNLE